MQSRLAKLALAIGRDCAERELDWMLKQSQPSIQGLLDRRLAGEPIQYILGSTPFGPIDILTRPPTLIPRPETEDWTLRLAQTLTPNHPIRVLDLCTGSGCIPLLLCHLWPRGSTTALGVDIAPDAVQLAADNAARVQPRNPFTPILGDVHDPALFDHHPPFDVITANPPYIPFHAFHSLPSDVKDYEDPRALIGGTDGLVFYRAIAALLGRPHLLAPRAVIALEVGHDQAHAVKHILARALPRAQIDIWRDPWDKERVVFARAA